MEKEEVKNSKTEYKKILREKTSNIVSSAKVFLCSNFYFLAVALCKIMTLQLFWLVVVKSRVTRIAQEKYLSFVSFPFIFIPCWKILFLWSWKRKHVDSQLYITFALYCDYSGILLQRRKTKWASSNSSLLLLTKIFSKKEMSHYFF